MDGLIPKLHFHPDDDRLKMLRPAFACALQFELRSATCTTNPDGSKRVIRRTPLTPSRVAFQKRSRPIPLGLMAPIPVIATRRMNLSLPLVLSSV